MEIQVGFHIKILECANTYRTTVGFLLKDIRWQYLINRDVLQAICTLCLLFTEPQ